VRAKGSDCSEGTVGTLGKGNRYRKALADNGIAEHWFTKHDNLDTNPSRNTGLAPDVRTGYGHEM